MSNTLLVKNGTLRTVNNNYTLHSSTAYRKQVDRKFWIAYGRPLKSQLRTFEMSTYCTELTPVNDNLQDAGIWDDKHIAPIRRIADLVHSQKIPLGIQLAHAGRKASTSQPWRGYYRVNPEDGGWPDERVLAPSALAYDEKHADPREITKEEILEIEVSCAVLCGNACANA